jgi:hypothetical protein
MATNTETAEKRTAVEYLNFGKKTIARVSWECWSFRIVGPFQVEVTNESYGYLKDDHQYIVTVEERDGVVVPAECECKADLYHEEYACKHRVSLATIGGPVVLEAAAEFLPKETSANPTTETVTGAELLKSDGGVPATEAEPDTCLNGQEGCPGPDGDDLPCFACYEGE